MELTASWSPGPASRTLTRYPRAPGCHGCWKQYLLQVSLWSSSVSVLCFGADFGVSTVVSHVKCPSAVRARAHPLAEHDLPVFGEGDVVLVVESGVSKWTFALLDAVNGVEGRVLDGCKGWIQAA